MSVEPAEAALVEALLAARILIARKDAAGRPTLRLAHDAVFTSWPQAAAAAQASRDFYRVRSDVEDAQRRWQEYGRPADRLLQPGVPLAEAEKLTSDFGRELPAELTAFVAASRNRARARQRLVAAAAIFFFVLAIAATGAGVLAYREQQQATASATAPNKRWPPLRRPRTVSSSIWRSVSATRSEIPAALVKDILDRALALQDQLTKSGQVTADLKHSKASALDETASTLLAIGDTAGAMAAAQQAKQIDEELLASDPGNVVWERSLSVANSMIGNDAGVAGQSHSRAEGLSRRPRRRRAAGKSPSGQRAAATRSVHRLRESRPLRVNAWTMSAKGRTTREASRLTRSGLRAAVRAASPTPTASQSGRSRWTRATQRTVSREVVTDAGACDDMMTLGAGDDRSAKTWIVAGYPAIERVRSSAGQVARGHRRNAAP